MDSQAHGNVALTGPFIGLVVTAVLSGFTILQAMQYYVRFPKDSLTTKCKVAFVCLLDFLQFVFAIILVHTFFNSSREGQSSAKIVWSLKALTIAQTILTVSVQFIYLQRIHSLSNIPAINKPNFSKIINVAVLLIAFGAICGSAAFIYGVLQAEGIMASEITLGPRWALIISLWDNVAIDVIITALTCFVLHKNRIEIGLDHISKWSNRILLSLFTYSLATGLLTSVAAALLAIIYLALPDTLDFMSLALIMAKLYTNSLLSLVQSIRQQINKDYDSNKSKLPSIIVFGGSSHRSRLTAMDATVTGNNNISPSPAGLDLELNAENHYTEDIKLPEFPNMSPPYIPLDNRRGEGNNLPIWESQITEAERVPRRVRLNWQINRRSSV